MSVSGVLLIRLVRRALHDKNPLKWSEHPENADLFLRFSYPDPLIIDHSRNETRRIEPPMGPEFIGTRACHSSRDVEDEIDWNKPLAYTPQDPAGDDGISANITGDHTLITPSAWQS